MLSQKAKELLESQQYRIIGQHSAVKVCGWTKSMIKGEGGCYKLKFYGIMSHQCMQMTTSMSCANRCKFCWRGYKAPVSKEWKWGVDEPLMILEGSMHQHHKLLDGYGGHPKANKTPYEQSKEIRHVALSLTGEPIIYPKINELIKEFDARGVSTFLVTNAQYPEHIRDLNTVTQLYLSIDAPNQHILKEIDLPLFDDYWERMNQSLEYLSRKKGRTCLRLTLVKGINDVEPENYARLVMKGNPDFIEVKSYMHVGESRKRLTMEHMPWHEEVVAFSQKLVENLPDYAIVSEHVPSRVVMIAKKKFKRDDGWHTWIDFEKYNTLVNSGVEFSVDDFLKKTPQTGLSGRITKQEVEEKVRKKHEQHRQEKEKIPQKADGKKPDEIFVNESAETDLQ